MKVRLVWVVIVFCASSVAAQKISFSGTVFDYNGSVVSSANLTATADKSKVISSASANGEGRFRLDLEPGLYSIEISRDGFLKIKYPEFMIVNAQNGMKMDFVMFGARYHEPCGVSGEDCLPAKMLIREFSVKYSPGLKQLIEDFSDLNKNKKDK